MSAIVRRRGYNSLVGVLRPPIEVARQMPAFTNDRWKIIGLHALDTRIATWFPLVSQ
jgi:hypothetical protein